MLHVWNILIFTYIYHRFRRPNEGRYSNPPWSIWDFFGDESSEATAVGHWHLPLWNSGRHFNGQQKPEAFFFFLPQVGLHSLKLTACTWKWWFPIGISEIPGVYFQGRTVSFRGCTLETSPKKNWVEVLHIAFFSPRFGKNSRGRVRFLERTLR